MSLAMAQAVRLSVLMTAGKSVSLDAEGQLAIDGSNDVGRLGSVIVLGFGPAEKASTASTTGNRAVMNPKNSSNATSGILGITGEASKCFKLQIITVIGLAFHISLSS